MNLEPLVAILEEANLGTFGEDIFINQLPAACTKGVVIRIPLTGILVDHELPDFYRPRVQVIVRAPTQAEGDLLANQVKEALSMSRRVILNNRGDNSSAFLVHYLLPDTLPIVYPRSDGNGFEWSINFDGCFVLNS